MEQQTLLSGNIRRLISGIESSNIRESDTLIELLEKSGLNSGDVENFRNHHHDPLLSYGRSIVYEGSHFVIYLMSWAPGDFTAIHSHGLTDWGAVLFFTEINHRLYELKGNSIYLVSKSVVPAGTIVAVQGDLIHAMGNLTANPFISLHIYGSNHNIGNANKDSKIYDLEYRKIRVTNGAAYLNSGLKNAGEVGHEITTDKETLLDYYSNILPFYKKNNIQPIVSDIEKILKTPDAYLIEVEVFV